MPRSFSRLAIVILGILAALPGFSQTTDVEPRRIGRPTIIIIRPPDPQPVRPLVPLVLDSLDVKVTVVGNLATTRFEISYYNPNDRILEGRFYFPLGEGCTVSQFALEVDGKLRDAVAVEKEKGRAVYESVVRRQIDPGLVELARGNTFQARLYPVPAKGYKRLVFSYDEDLRDLGRGFFYRLPLAFRETAKSFKLQVDVLKQETAPELPAENELVNLRFRQWQERYTTEFTQANYRPDKSLAFVLPKTPAFREVTVETDTGGAWFAATVGTRPQAIARTLPKTVSLFWDASGSGAARDHAKEFALLDAYFKKAANLSVRLIVFRDRIEAGNEAFSVTGGDWKGLRSRLEKMDYDGGTQLGALDLRNYQADEQWLFSDGIGNFGKRDLITGQAPVISVSSSPSVDHAFLAVLAAETGGVYINLAERTTAEALALLLNEPWSFLRADFNQTELADCWPARQTPAGANFGWSGRLLTDKAEVTLHFGTGSRVRFSQKITITKAGADKPGLVRRLWAQRKLAGLLPRYEKNEAEITALAKSYGLVSRATSLIVLDRIEDYIQHRIVPPVELQPAYFAALTGEEVKLSEKRTSHLDQIAVKFTALKSWWHMEFPKGEWPGRNADKKSEAERSRNGEGAAAPEAAEERDLMMARPASRDEAHSANGGRAPGSPQAKERGGADNGAEGGITLKKWTPDTPYLKELEKVAAKDRYPTYLRLRKEYAGSSAFFLDVADFFSDQTDTMLGLRILSNIAEMELENPQLLRILAHRLSQLGEHALAEAVFREVLAMRGEEPQSYRDLALVLERLRRFEDAGRLLWTVIEREWDGRFPDIQLIALVELNAMLARQPGTPRPSGDGRFYAALPVDLRVILNWDADNTDMDLWVTDPNGEKCFYGSKLSYQGGRMSMDFTGGYGPEEFLLKAAKPGEYKVEINYYGNSQQILSGATTVQVQLFLNYGRANQQMKEITLRLKDAKEVIHVGNFTIKVRNGKVSM